MRDVRSVSMFGDDAVFDHVGVAVESFETAVDAVGADVARTYDEHQRVSVGFFSVGGVVLELIEPAGSQSPVAANLKKGQQLVHLCFRVKDIESAIETSRAHGFHRIARPVAAPAFDGRRIAWIFSRTFGLVELLEQCPSEER